MKKHVLALGAGTLLDVADAAVEWWAARRPAHWSVEQHLGNPRINCPTEREKTLAMRVAELVAIDRGMKRGEPPVGEPGR